MDHKVIRSKMKKGLPLMDDPIISRHVPDTEWFHDSSLQRMLHAYSLVYIKPDIGRKGDGIIRVEKLNNSESKIWFKQTSLRCSTKTVYPELKKIMDPNKKYIVQQGIELATYHQRPFDVRVVLQKPLNRWQLTWMSAKVAPRKNSIVTNVAKGAKDVKLMRTLQGVDQSLSRYKVLQELVDVSYQIAQILGSRFPLNIVGLDMGIDKKGKIWFIEANTKPDFSGLKEFDPQQYQKYLEAKKLTERR